MIGHSNPPPGGGSTHEERAACTNALRLLMESHGGVLGATLSTSDGFEIASVASAAGAHVQGGKLPAITSSLKALSMAAVTELELGSFQSVTIEGETGRVLTIGVRSGSREFVLSVMAAKPSLLALNLIATRDCALRIVAALAPHRSGIHAASVIPLHQP